MDRLKQQAKEKYDKKFATNKMKQRIKKHYNLP